MPNAQIQKYTNTQIQHMTKCQKDPICGIFLKRGLFKGFKNYISMCQTRKYKNANTQIQHCKVPERPEMWYIFEKRIFQGYQKLYTGPSVSCFGIFFFEPRLMYQRVKCETW